MTRKIIYIINPIAGTKKKDVIEKYIHQQTTAKNIPFEIIHANSSGNYETLIQKINTENITDVVAVGGDGTLNHILASLKHLPIQFGILPCGSGNSLAFAAKIPKKIPQALQVIFDGHANHIDAFYINNQFSCALSGLGFDAVVANSFANKKRRGLFTYIHQSFLHFFKADAYHFEIQLNDFHFKVRAFLISIANSNQFGNQVTIAPQASLSDGLLDIVIIQKMNKFFLPFTILKQLRAKKKMTILAEQLQKKNIIYFQTPTLKIRNIQLAPLHIDGEPCKTEQAFNILIIKNCFKLIQPAT